MRNVSIALAVLALSVAAPAAAEEPFKVVANLEISAESLSRAQLSDIFLKRATVFPGGGATAPVDLAEDSKTFEAFSQGVHGKPGSLVRAFWKKVAATGRDSPPPVRHSDEEVLAFVRTTRGAIGYVSAAAPTSGVKVVRIGN
jgi:ABC-type phosphate transport system substrate-binding protein